ncbi:MAG: RDD family protein [Chitinophagaceae bacterium]|nr:RDD family protein [Chitinophagaceae bacterium]
MAVIKVPTNFNIELEFEIPEFYRRLLALLIDMIIEYFYLRIAGEIYSSISRNSGYFDEDAGHNLWAIGLLLLTPIMLYHIILELTMNGQSLGKKVLGLRVVDEHGGKSQHQSVFNSLAAAIVRSVDRNDTFLYRFEPGF